MTLSDTVASKGAELGDRQPHDGYAGAPGPNKDAVARPSGAGALGNEIGAEIDASRERADAIASGESLPAQSQLNDGSTVAGLTRAQLNGEEKGFAQAPSSEQRQQNQAQKNSAAHGDVLDARSIAQNSAGTANYNPQTQNPDAIRSSANSRPEEILDTAGRSGGTESGFGAYQGGIVNQAGTDNVAE